MRQHIGSWTSRSKRRIRRQDGSRRKVWATTWSNSYPTSPVALLPFYTSIWRGISFALCHQRLPASRSWSTWMLPTTCSLSYQEAWPGLGWIALSSLATTFLCKSQECWGTGGLYSLSAITLGGCVVRLEAVPSLLETCARYLRTSGTHIPPDEVVAECQILDLLSLAL